MILVEQNKIKYTLDFVCLMFVSVQNRNQNRLDEICGTQFQSDIYKKNRDEKYHPRTFYYSISKILWHALAWHL